MPGTTSPFDEERDKAVALAAVAARRWCLRGVATDGPDGKRLIEDLMAAFGWVSRYRRSAGQPYLGSIADLVDFWTRPVAEWLPGGPDQPLVVAGQPTALCEDLADDAGPEPAAEVEQKFMERVIARLSRRDDGPKVYAEFRQFLVENASAPEADIRRWALEVDAAPSEMFEPVGLECLVQVDGQPRFLPCPRCRWPMRRAQGMVACLADSCVRDGARFLLNGDGVVATGRHPPPDSLPPAGWRRLKYGLWRYTVLPGLEELALAARLRKLGGTVVDLWPNVDAYDLDVRCSQHRWRVDVKDHASPRALADRLRRRPTSWDLHIVVPDSREHDVIILSRLCADLTNLTFHSARSFLRLVRRAVEEL